MSSFAFNGEVSQSFTDWLIEGIKNVFSEKGYLFLSSPEDDTKLVFNLVEREKPRPFRRKAQATFVVSILETNEKPKEFHKEAYPFLVRTLSNHLMYVVHNGPMTEIHFLTPEQGHYSFEFNRSESDQEIFTKIFNRLEPLASSQLVIDNDFYEDLPEELWNGDYVTDTLRQAGKRLDQMNLLPTPFPLDEVLSNRDIRHIQKLYGIGGLSYGNLSARRKNNDFWMSASGIDKSNMKEVGKDFLHISGYDQKRNTMIVSIPPNVKPKRASVDAIEHWMIYNQHPQVGAIVHIHAWMEGIEATQINYPCGTIELATVVSKLVDESDDPTRAVIGLKNHGLTITGKNLDDIFERINGKIILQVPMG